MPKRFGESGTLVEVADGDIPEPLVVPMNIESSVRAEDLLIESSDLSVTATIQSLKKGAHHQMIISFGDGFEPREAKGTKISVREPQTDQRKSFQIVFSIRNSIDVAPNFIVFRQSAKVEGQLEDFVLAKLNLHASDTGDQSSVIDPCALSYKMVIDGFETQIEAERLHDSLAKLWFRCRPTTPSTVGADKASQPTIRMYIRESTSLRICPYPGPWYIEDCEGEKGERLLDSTLRFYRFDCFGLVNVGAVNERKLTNQMIATLVSGMHSATTVLGNDSARVIYQWESKGEVPAQRIVLDFDLLHFLLTRYSIDSRPGGSTAEWERQMSRQISWGTLRGQPVPRQVVSVDSDNHTKNSKLVELMQQRQTTFKWLAINEQVTKPNISDGNFGDIQFPIKLLDFESKRDLSVPLYQ